MSAFIESNKVINEIAYALVEDALDTGIQAPEELAGKSVSEIADALYEANVISVNARYGEDTPTAYGQYREPEEKPSVMQAYKSMRSWQYQSCESDASMSAPVYDWVAGARAVFERDYEKYHGIAPDKTKDWHQCRWS